VSNIGRTLTTLQPADLTPVSWTFADPIDGDEEARPNPVWQGFATGQWLSMGPEVLVTEDTFTQMLLHLKTNEVAFVAGSDHDEIDRAYVEGWGSMPNLLGYVVYIVEDICGDCGTDAAWHLDSDECEDAGIDTRDGLGCAIRGYDQPIRFLPA
jgi:hypothetical protein